MMQPNFLSVRPFLLWARILGSFENAPQSRAPGAHPFIHPPTCPKSWPSDEPRLVGQAPRCPLPPGIIQFPLLAASAAAVPPLRHCLPILSDGGLSLPPPTTCLPRSGPRLFIHRYILNFDGAQLTLEPSKLGLQWVNEALGHKQYGAHPEKAGTGKFVLSVACWNPGGKLLACGFVDARSFLGSEHQIVQATDDFLQA